MAKKSDHGIAAGQYWAVKVRGTGGDLVLGKIISVRTNKEDPLIISENLLSGGTSTKLASILLSRNIRISKRQAMKFVKMLKDGKTKEEIREEVVKYCQDKSKKKSPAQFEFDLPRVRLAPYSTICYAADQRKREELDWSSLAWIPPSWQKPRNEIERKAIAFVQKRFPNAFAVHIYEVVDVVADLMEKK